MGTGSEHLTKGISVTAETLEELQKLLWGEDGRSGYLKKKRDETGNEDRSQTIKNHVTVGDPAQKHEKLVRGGPGGEISSHICTLKSSFW